MTIVAAQDRPGIAAWGLADQAVSSLTLNSVLSEDPDVAERARQLRSAIDHHRAETRRLIKAAKQHRTTLAELIAQRDQHAVELRNAGWQLAPIARLYRLTRERVRQIVAASTRDVDDGEGVA